jgi:EamA domain-containing membrane protein RarD
VVTGIHAHVRIAARTNPLTMIGVLQYVAPTFFD